MHLFVPKRWKRRAADLFCGAGGTTTGAAHAAAAVGCELDMLAINHWETAVETHAANHPWAEHRCANVEDVRPEQYFGLGELDDLFASPECTHHSRARGSRPVDDQRRCGARRVTDWAERVKPKRIWVENVVEFKDWGPLKRNRKGEWVPDEKFKGALFTNWVRDLEILGYRVGWRVQCAADHGAPTTRRRLIVQAARKPLRLVWPEASHRDPELAGDLFGELPAWLNARDHVIDWGLPCASIFTREKRLSDNTLMRIEAGLRAQGIEAFLVQVAHGESGGRRWRATAETFGTVTCENGHALVQPFILPGQNENPADKGKRRHAVGRPLPTVCATGHFSLVQPFVCSLRGTSEEALQHTAQGICRPLSTVATSGAHHALVHPQIIEYYGTGTFAGVDVPLGTITCHDRFGLSLPSIYTADGREWVLDIGYRMLAAHELAAAMSFPREYVFKGRTKKCITRQIGNAVPPKLAEAHYGAALQVEGRAA